MAIYTEQVATEFCSNCETEVELFWNVDEFGYKAYCPHCGARLMLCDACMHPNGEFCDRCDYSVKTDSCKHNPKAATPVKTDERMNFILKFVKETGDFTDCNSFYQLKSLWTAYCLVLNVDVDSQRYDENLRKIWDAMQEADNCPYEDPNLETAFEHFDFDMCRELV